MRIRLATVLRIGFRGQRETLARQERHRAAYAPFAGPVRPGMYLERYP